MKISGLLLSEVDVQQGHFSVIPPTGGEGAVKQRGLVVCCALRLKSGPRAGYSGTYLLLSLGAVCAFRPNHLSLSRCRPTPAAVCLGLTSPHPQEFIYQSPEAEVRLWLSRVLGTKIIQATQPNVLTVCVVLCGCGWRSEDRAGWTVGARIHLPLPPWR